jgi:hypothetical protein
MKSTKEILYRCSSVGIVTRLLSRFPVRGEISLLTNRLDRLWLRHNAASRKVAGSIPDEVIGYFNLLNLSSCTMTVGLTQPITEMSTRNRLGDKGRPACKADNLTASCEPIV